MTTDTSAAETTMTPLAADRLKQLKRYAYWIHNGSSSFPARGKFKEWLDLHKNSLEVIMRHMTLAEISAELSIPDNRRQYVSDWRTEAGIVGYKVDPRGASKSVGGVVDAETDENEDTETEALPERKASTSSETQDVIATPAPNEPTVVALETPDEALPPIGELSPTPPQADTQTDVVDADEPEVQLFAMSFSIADLRIMDGEDFSKIWNVYGRAFWHKLHG